MGGAVVSRLLIIGGGLLYPAYNSYKAVKAASLREYVRWIMYWVVFAIYLTAETFTDIFVSWLPFYYEAKVLFVLWLALPYTKGSTFLYRKLIHPNLSRREQDIDLFLEHAKERGYQAVVDVGSRGLNIAANVVVNAAVKGHGVVTDKLKSYSVMDLRSLPDDMPLHSRHGAAAGGLRDPRLVRERLHTTGNLLTSAEGGDQSPVFGAGGQIHQNSNFNPQYPAYSMFDLSSDSPPSSPTQDTAVAGRHVPAAAAAARNDDDADYFDNNVPTHTNDDMRIPRRANYAQESVAEPKDYSINCRTMPKSKVNHASTHNKPNYRQPKVKTASATKGKTSNWHQE